MRNMTWKRRTAGTLQIFSFSTTWAADFQVVRYPMEKLIGTSCKSRSHPTKPDVSLERVHGVLAAVILSNISARRVSGRRYSGRDD